jgi:hypothetical protein
MTSNAEQAVSENESHHDATQQRDEKRAVETLIGQLAQRGVRLFGGESPAELGDIAEEVDRFEAVRTALGVDSMRNAPDSAMPEDPRVVLPARRDDESVVRYTARINAATEFLRSIGDPNAEP